jgi:hypothetical protein
MRSANPAVDVVVIEGFARFPGSAMLGILFARMGLIVLGSIGAGKLQ